MITIEYIGGTDEANGSSEGYRLLEHDFIMKGYMLKISTPPIAAGRTVEWSIKRGADEAGTFHQDGQWRSYAEQLPGPPSSATIYWRSDTRGDITDAYQIAAQYVPAGAQEPKTIRRTVSSRLLDESVDAMRDNFNEDTDMVQRAMIQVFFLDKGRLQRYRIGKYDKGNRGYYLSSHPRRVQQWSPIADEVWNFAKFALGTNPGVVYSLPLSVVAGIWEQFALILAVPLPAAVTSQDASFPLWLDAAVATSLLSVPQEFPRPPGDVLKYQVSKESNGKHSGAPLAPLAVSNVLVGEAPSGSGTSLHTYTDDGIGFAKIQPYNGVGLNIFDPAQNILRQAQIMKGNIDGVPNDIVGAERVWRAYVRYNTGRYFLPDTPAQLRDGSEDEQRGAAYADAIFNAMAIPLP